MPVTGGSQRWAQAISKVAAQPGDSTVLNAADFALVGDGKTDDSGALQSAVDAAAAQQLPLIIPPGTYAVTKSIEFRPNSFTSAYGARLVTFIPDLGDPGTSFPTVRISDVENVAIHGLEVDGRKDSFDHSQWKHGFALNNTRNVWLYHCRANRCKGDGVILENKNIGDVCVDTLVESCSFGQNYRMGGTASGALRARFQSCVFWGTVGTKPMCGFDVEPDRADVTCQDVSFYQCDFIDNGIIGSGEGYGFNVSFFPDATGSQRGVYLENCTFARNGAAGIDLYRVPRNVELNNCFIYDNAQDGIRVMADAADILVQGGKISSNGQHGLHCAAAANAPCENIIIDSVEITSNGWRDTQPKDGIHLNNVVDSITVSSCTVSNSSGYGLFVGPTVTNLTLSDSVFTDNNLGDVFPDIDIADLDEEGIDREFRTSLW
ncbi:MAG: right-handed parallel beta-helix repeat-containing protein [Thermomicrobiales bacterium]